MRCLVIWPAMIFLGCVIEETVLQADVMFTDGAQHRGEGTTVARVCLWIEPGGGAGLQPYCLC